MLEKVTGGANRVLNFGEDPPISTLSVRNSGTPQENAPAHNETWVYYEHMELRGGSMIQVNEAHRGAFNAGHFACPNAIYPPQ